MPLKVKGHTVPHWQALENGKHEKRWLNCNSSFNTSQEFLNSANLLHKRGFDDSQSSNTVTNSTSKTIYNVKPITAFIKIPQKKVKNTPQMLKFS